MAQTRKISHQVVVIVAGLHQVLSHHLQHLRHLGFDLKDRKTGHRKQHLKAEGGKVVTRYRLLQLKEIYSKS